VRKLSFRARGGFTLVEALIATLIIGAMVSAVTGVFVVALTQQAGSYAMEMHEQDNMRAVMELEHAFSHCWGYDLGDNVSNPALPAGVYQGNVLRIYSRETTESGDRFITEFAFVPSDYDSDSEVFTGRIGILRYVEGTSPSGGYYYFGDEFEVPIDTSQGIYRVFRVSDSGVFSYFWRIQGADGPVTINGTLAVAR